MVPDPSCRGTFGIISFLPQHIRHLHLELDSLEHTAGARRRRPTEYRQLAYKRHTVLIRSIRSSRVTRALAKRKFWPRHASQSPFGGRFAPLGLHLGVISTINGNIRVSGRKTNLLFLVTRHRGWRIDRISTVMGRLKRTFTVTFRSIQRHTLLVLIAIFCPRSSCSTTPLTNPSVRGD